MLTNRNVHHARNYNGATGGERIQAAIEAAEGEPGHNIVVVGPTGPDADGRWVLTRAIELPSHTTLILQGAYLFLADKANDNLIRNRDPDERNTDIHIIGIGGARLDGNPANQDRAVRGRDVEIWMEERGMELSRSTKEVIGDVTVAEFEARRASEQPTIASPESEGAISTENSLLQRNIGVHFHNVDNLSLRGFAIGPTNAWAFLLERVRDVQVSGIILAQDGREPNQDGIHIFGPAERITVSDIVGTCGDDAIALNAKGGSDESRGGPITGVTINNVVIRNRWCSGILRTVPVRGCAINGVHASNLQLLGGEGYSEGHAVLKFGQTRPGIGCEPCAPDEHANITVENVFAKDWRGPYCAVFSPVKNLTVRGARGSHTGPFFHNFGQAIEGLILENCRTMLIGGPEEPFVTGMMQFILEQYEYFGGQSLEGTPAAILLDGGLLKDVEIREVMMRSALRPEDMVTGTGVAGLRLVRDARIDSLRVSGLTIDGYESGIIIEEGVQGEDLRFERVRMRKVATPWTILDADVVSSDTTLNFG